MRQHTTSTLRFVQPVTPTVDVVAFVGTRPEAIKLAPVVLAARRQEAGEIPGLMMRLATTGQHEEVVRQALAVFELEVDHRLQCDRLTGSLHELFGVLVAQMGAFLASQPPAAVIVQGDTSSAAAGALAAFYQRVPVVHLEAGLTTRSLHSPFPEEGHRRLISQLASLHLAPTGGAAANLVARGVAAVAELDRVRLETHRRTMAAERDALNDLDRQRDAVEALTRGATAARVAVDGAVVVACPEKMQREK